MKRKIIISFLLIVLTVISILPTIVTALIQVTQYKKP